MNKNQILLVEGHDDLHIVAALCQKYKLVQNFDIQDAKGINNLFKLISPTLKKSELKTLGLLLDADQDFSKRYEALKKSLPGYGLPVHLPPEGLIIEAEETVKLGIWIMPNNQNKGMMEDFICDLIPAGGLKSFVEDTLSSLEEKGLHGYQPDLHRTKAIVHTWLSWQADPGTPMGFAITKKYFEPTINATTELFVNWLRALFSA